MTEQNTITHERVEVGVWPADPEHDDDNTVVVQVDTGLNTGNIRVNLNDAVIFDGDPEKTGTPEVTQVVTAFQRVDRLEAAAMQLALDLGVLRSDLSARARELGVRL